MISTNVYNVNCAEGGLMGTGLNHCKFDFNRATTLEFSKRNFKYDDATGDTLAYIQEKQQTGDVTILQGVVDITFDTADDNITTRTGSGIEKLSGKNPIKVTFTFDNGMWFAKAVQTLTSFNQYNLAMYDAEGNKLFAETKSGEYKGFACYQVNAGPYTPSNGADSAMMTITLQLNREEWDNRAAWIVSENLDYNAETELDGYNDLNIEIVEATDSSSNIVFDVYSKADNKKVAVSGLDESDFALTIDGTSDAIVSVTPSATIAGRYTAVSTATLSASEEVALKSYDSTLSTDIVNVEGVLYKSNTDTFTVTV